MDLIEILDKNLRTKNEIRDILGETNNISRYPIAIHNNIAVKYNAGYIQGYYDRYYELNNSEFWVSGPIEIYEYGVDNTYYQEYTTEVLTDIMRDCLNYRLGMKDELEIDTDEFVTYPNYLRDKLNSVYDIGYSDGKDQADEDYEGNDDVDLPTVSNDRNKITMSISQTGARIKYKINEDGIEYEYNTPIIISENCTVYAKSVLGRSISDWVTLQCTFDPNGFISFITPPTIKQEGNLIYLSTSMNNTTIEYKINANGSWNIYTHAISVTTSDSIIYCKALRNGEYSNTVAQPISHSNSLTRPANVRCNIEDLGIQRKITLTCETSGVEIRYAINESTGDFFRYNEPIYRQDEHFVVYAYSIKNGEESPNRLYWKFDKNETLKPQIVHFTDNGRQLIISCVTENSIIYYRFGDVGQFINTATNYVVLNPADKAYIQAYSSLNGINSELQFHTFNLIESSKVPKPYAYIDDNDYIIITSSYSVFYTLDGTDPILGKSYYQPILINDVVTLKCVAKDGGNYSDTAVYTFQPKTVNVIPGGGDNTTPIDFTKDWFKMSGCSKITYSGTGLYYSTGSAWKRVESTTVFDPNTTTCFYGDNITKFTPIDGNANISGDILSLVKGQQFDSIATYTRSFENFFSDSTVTNAYGLVLRLNNVSSDQYKGMFMNCNKLLSAPSLTAGSVGIRGYMNMFKNCSNLVNAPSLPATSLSSNCYEGMFEGCTSIITAPYLSSMTLSDSCYKSMFKNCIYLTTPPYLPAINLSSSCYESMFEGCTNLVRAPELPATNLYQCNECYKRMFYGCRNLNYIKAMFKQRPASGQYTANWVYGVADSGEFVKNADVDWDDRGVSAIPVNWNAHSEAAVGYIIDIIYLENIGRIRIIASNGDDIYYSIDSEECNLQYNDNDRPIITRSCDVYARCYNGYQYSSIYGPVHIDISYPQLVASVYNRKVTISSSNYQYARIKYVLVEYEADIQYVTESDFINYPTGGFTINQDWWIVMRGYVDGQSNYVTQSSQYLIANISAPDIILWTNTNDTKTYVKIVYPKPEMDPVIYWSENDAENINNLYTQPIVLEWYNDEQSKVYRAKAEVTYNGERVWSSIAEREIFKGESGSNIILSEPSLYQLDNTSNWWYVEYEGERFTEWDNTSVNIGYRFEIGGETQIYTNGINLRDMKNPLLSDQDVTVYVWAYTNNLNKTREVPFVCRYHAASGSTTPDKPTIHVNPTGNEYTPYKITLSNPTIYQQYESLQNWIYIEVVDTLDHPDMNTYFDEETYFQVSQSGYVSLPYWVLSCKIKAKSYIWWNASDEGNWSEENTEQYWDTPFVNTSNPSSIPIPTLTFDEYETNKFKILIDVPREYLEGHNGNYITRQFTCDPTRAEWGRNATVVTWEEESIGEDGFYLTRDYPKFYGGYFKVRWIYNLTGVASEWSEWQYWRAPYAPQGFQVPEITVLPPNTGDNTSKDFPVLKINNPNEGYSTYWRIDNALFAGGTINTTKYNDTKLWTWNYGITLDQFLISGKVEAWSEDDEYVGTYNPDLYSSQEFYFPRYAEISAPIIEYSYYHGVHEILVSNNNKYVTNYWRKDNETTYHVANKYGSSLGIDPDSCYCYAYSQWGDQISSTVYAYYDSGKFTSYDPPTVWANPNPDGLTYTLNIKNNSTLTNLFWKIDPTEWVLEGDDYSQFNQYIYNMGWRDYRREHGIQYNTTYQVLLKSSLKYGYVEAFSTDSMSSVVHPVTEPGGRDEVTLTFTYEYINGKYQS